MKKVLFMGIVLVVIVAAALANPSEDQHQDHIIAQYKADNPISGTLGVGHAFAEVVTYHNYVFFSKTTIGEEQISIGGLGILEVRSLDINDLPDYLLEQLPEDMR